MSSTEIVRAQIKRLYETNPDIHITLSLSQPKLALNKAEAKITGVYKQLFQIEEYSEGKPQRHALQYIDVLINRVVISELENGRV